MLLARKLKVGEQVVEYKVAREITFTKWNVKSSFCAKSMCKRWCAQEIPTSFITVIQKYEE